MRRSVGCVALKYLLRIGCRECRSLTRVLVAVNVGVLVMYWLPAV